jgi:hypothetical protein
MKLWMRYFICFRGLSIQSWSIMLRLKIEPVWSLHPTWFFIGLQADLAFPLSLSFSFFFSVNTCLGYYIPSGLVFQTNQIPTPLSIFHRKAFIINLQKMEMVWNYGDW